MSSAEAAQAASSRAVTGDTPDLEIVIVTYRGLDLVRACLSSLADHPLTSRTMHVHVVDNASGDGTARAIAEEFPWVHLTPLASNVGFSRGNNSVLRNCRASYVLLLNPDTEVYEGTLDEMLALVESDPSIGVAGCRLVQPDGTLDHAAKRNFPTLVGAAGQLSGIGRWAGAPACLKQYRAPSVGEYDSGPVDSVNGAFMLVRREAMDCVGLLDEGYWMYGEDLDWCRRFHDAGWRVHYHGQVSALHVKGGSSGRHRGWRSNWAFHRSMGRFYRRYEGGNSVIVDSAVYCAIIAKFVHSAAMSKLRRTYSRAWHR